jgi:glucose/arabinose dehydrogenase
VHNAFHVGEKVPAGKVKNAPCLDIKGKAVLLQAWSSPEGSRKLKLPHYISTAQDGGKVVSLTLRPPLPPGNIPDTHFC